MKYSIVIKDEVYDKIHTLMYNIQELNKGLEIGGWLLGDWSINDDSASLYLTDFIIPKQSVSKTEVDISPESMTDTIKTVGIDQSNRIKAHWHIHPFGGGPTNWSGTDDGKIADFMEPVKGRDIFVFLLSSEDTIKARVVANYKKVNEFLGVETTECEDIDDIEVWKESLLVSETSLDELRETIDEKVEEIKYSYSKKRLYTDNESQYELELKPKGMLVTLDKNFNEFVKGMGGMLNGLPAPSNVTLGVNTIMFHWSNDKLKSYPRLPEVLENELIKLEDDYNSLMNDPMEYENKYFS